MLGKARSKARHRGHRRITITPAGEAYLAGCWGAKAPPDNPIHEEYRVLRYFAARCPDLLTPEGRAFLDGYRTIRGGRR
jgi:hypothetical protein